MNFFNNLSYAFISSFINRLKRRSLSWRMTSVVSRRRSVPRQTLWSWPRPGWRIAHTAPMWNCAVMRPSTASLMRWNSLRPRSGPWRRNLDSPSMRLHTYFTCRTSIQLLTASKIIYIWRWLDIFLILINFFM